LHSCFTCFTEIQSPNFSKGLSNSASLKNIGPHRNILNVGVFPKKVHFFFENPSSDDRKIVIPDFVLKKTKPQKLRKKQFQDFFLLDFRISFCEKFLKFIEIFQNNFLLPVLFWNFDRRNNG